MKSFVRIIICVLVLSFCLTTCGTNFQSTNINSKEESSTAYESNEKQETTDFYKNVEESSQLSFNTETVVPQSTDEEFLCTLSSALTARWDADKAFDYENDYSLREDISNRNHCIKIELQFLKAFMEKKFDNTALEVLAQQYILCFMLQKNLSIMQRMNFLKQSGPKYTISVV